MKIVTVGISLSDSEGKRLRGLGELVSYDGAESKADFLGKTDDADVVYSDGEFLLESLPDMKDVFVTYPYIELGQFDSEELAKKNVYVANARGGNRDSIVEWVVFMTLALFRKFIPKVRVAEDIAFERTRSLAGKAALVVGHGNIGTKIGEVLTAFDMDVKFFNRGDDLGELSKDADLVVNALSVNRTSKNLLDRDFFAGMKEGAYFVSFVRQDTYDLESLINAIDSGIVAGAAIDCDPEDSGDTRNDFYQKALACEKILVTPHVAYATVEAAKKGREVVIENIEAFAAGEMKNVVKKK